MKQQPINRNKDVKDILKRNKKKKEKEWTHLGGHDRAWTKLLRP
jgi:hypothetical protein